MSNELRVEKISGIAPTRDTNYYFSRGQHNLFNSLAENKKNSSQNKGKSFKEILDIASEDKRKKDEDLKDNKVGSSLKSLEAYEAMRRVSQSFSNNEKKDDEHVVLDKQKEYAYNAYKENQENMTKVIMFKSKYKVEENEKTKGQSENSEHEKEENER